MSISRQNLSIVIVTLKSEKVIHQCIQSIDQDITITVIENSDNLDFKNDLEKKYPNVKCELSLKNLGMGSGNNLGIKLSSTEYVLILNPDVILEKNSIEEVILVSKTISDFAILSPISSDTNFPNYQLNNNKKINNQTNLPFEVNNVDGFAMLLNKNKLDKILSEELSFSKGSYFDENFFMYLENNDLCKRIIKNGGKIYIAPKSKINHLAAKGVDSRYANEVELSRNWHWIWSKFYFNKKHYGFFKALIEGFPGLCSSILKYTFFLLINNKLKKKIYFNRASGFLNAFLGNSSWYRPKLDD